MATVTERTPRVKSRTVRMLTPGMLRISETVGKRTTVAYYTVTKIVAEWGPAYEVSKVRCADFLGLETEEPYAVNLSSGSPSCECKGHLAHGHKTVCRHIASLLALAAVGKLS